VNQQLIAYYFEGKEGLYREIGRRWRAYEAETFPAELPFAEILARYVQASVDPRLGARLLAWEGLGDMPEDAEESAERTARLRREVELIRERQLAGELDDHLDAAALLLIAMSAANALAVYPQLSRALFDSDGTSPELVAHYAQQLGRLFSTPRKV
jgi:AcrR family transcriptional regulator